MREGATTFLLDPASGVHSTERHASARPTTGAELALRFPIDGRSTLFVTMRDGVITEMDGTVRHIGTIRIARSKPPRTIKDFLFNLDLDSGTGWFSNRGGRIWGVLRSINVQFDRDRHMLVITSDEVGISMDEDGPLRGPKGTGRSVGIASIKVEMERVDEITTFSPGDDGGSQPHSAAGGVIGPDLIVGELDQLGSFGSAGTCSDSGALCTNSSPCPPPGTCENKIAAFSVATRSCNAGDAEIDWFQSTNRHPVISQTMYRLADNRFEQIGLAWVKHGFSAINGTFCGDCTPPAPPNQTSRLGVGCSDPYTASLNGDRTYLGPRSDINPHTGAFTVPFDATPFDNTIGRRLQVHENDLDPTLNPEALYFVEGHYISPDDATAGNGNNNASYRRITIEPPSESNGFRYVARRSAETGLTQVGRQAIRAWRDFDEEVVETDIQIPGEGLFILAARVADLGTGFWRYEYACQNMNSDSAASSFSVPLPAGVDVRNPGFHDVDHHSGEPFDGTDWLIVVDPVERAITWSTQRHPENPDANALRWGTLYNFRFEANAQPVDTATVTLGLFKGPLESVQVSTKGPSVGMIDCNRNGIIDACDIDCRATIVFAEGRTVCAVVAEDGCGTSTDCNRNGVPDECERDCDSNGVADTCDIAACPPDEPSCADCNENTVPDGCEDDCDGDGVPSDCDPDEDADDDGLDDCVDACPRTMTENACTCPDPVCCCFPFAGCICDCTAFSSQECLDVAGVPDCIESNICREGCLLGDADETGAVDLRDFAALQGCFGAPATEDCRRVFDFTEDSSVDLDDFGPFIDIFLGGGGTSNPCP